MRRTFLLLLILVWGFATAQSSASLFESVAKYNAKNDGSTDASEAIQKAVDYCEKNSIKTLLIPSGKYYLKRPVVFKRGGVQIIGTGALLREESWQAGVKKEFADNKPFDGCTFLVEKNSIGLLYDTTVVDPVKISNIQFLAKEGRTTGNTTAIRFISQFEGPTWPFIIENCNFRGFNYAVKFESTNQYCVAYLQMRQNAFSQNDECVYFSDIPKSTNTGQRNLSWGFDFFNNQCHDNSRVIRGAFAKDAVNIIGNNMEGNIPYADGTKPKNIVDIEVSNATVNFEGNHFESVISDCVYISSAFMKSEGRFFPYSGSTTSSELNKVFIKGNNFDGIDINKYKPISLKAMVVHNYDNYGLFVDECDLRTNETSVLNLSMSNWAKQNGSIIKTPFGKYENSAKAIAGYNSKTMISPGKSVSLNSPVCGINFIAVNKKDGAIFGTGDDVFQVPADAKFLGTTFVVNNPVSTGFLGVAVNFYLSYTINGKKVDKIITASGNYGTSIGFTSITGIIPNLVPKNAKNATVWTGLVTNVMGETDSFLANKYTIFSYSGSNPYFIPVY